MDLEYLFREIVDRPMGWPNSICPFIKLKETKKLDQNLAINFAQAVKAMTQAVFLIWFGIVWIFTSLFILVLDRQTFMMLLKETWPITILVFPMMFSGYKIMRRIFVVYPINPSTKHKSLYSRVELRHRKPEKVPLKL